MNILITGYKGFIGRNMMSYFGNKEGYHVSGWEWEKDPANWPDVQGYDWVIHLGANNDNNQSFDTLLEQNYEFSQYLFEQCQKYGVHMQYASTSAVYGNNRDCSEYSECKPITPVAVSKYLFDRWVFRQQHKSFVQGFRYFEVYGKWQYIKGTNACDLYKWRQQAKKNKVIELPDIAEHIKRDWVWVGDVCQLHFDFMNTVLGSGMWNVGSGLSHSDLDLAETIAEQENATIEYTSDSNYQRVNSCADLTHLKETIGKRKWLNVYEWLDTE